MLRTAVASGLLCALLACGGADREAALREASEQVAERRAVVERARDALEEREQALAVAEAERDRARQALRDAERRLDAARGEVARYASDDVLFRAVQRRLLEDDALEGVAISAHVEERVVTLRGSVGEAGQRDRAVDLARETPGVEGVESQIEVTGPPANPRREES